MRYACLFAICLLPLSAQQFPDGSALLKQSAEALNGYRTYQYTQTMTNSSMGGFAPETLVQGTNSGKMRQEMKVGSMPGILIVNDGQYMWMYMGMTKSYTKLPVGGDQESALEAFGGASFPDLSNFKSTDKVIRSETLDVDGQPHDCWVVESRMSDLPASDVPAFSMKNSILTHWIDKTTSIELKTATSGRITVAASKEPVDISSVIMKHNLKFDETLDDSLFVFTPPDGAKETSELIPGMSETLKAPKPEPAPTPGAGVENPAEPQAYVPSLTPIEEINPAYPEAARNKKVGFEVEVLATIDATGTPVHVEALTGSDILRPAALAAVKQERFRPVIRNGQPAAAFTNLTVIFADGDKPSAPEPDGEFMAQELALSARLGSLAAKFPRTPQQVLADLEQDRGGVSEHSSYSLSELAKVALDADQLDKAAAYASQLLQLKSDPNDGQATHDGNMVLGIVSLRNGNTVSAKHYLLESGQTKGSPSLNSFGPNMRLAKELLEKGEKDAVLQYFDQCRAFWKMGADRLDAWSAAVRQGRTPSFGTNLVY
jgi:outer membrane lipoprotein-sorting protein